MFCTLPEWICKQSSIPAIVTNLSEECVNISIGRQLRGNNLEYFARVNGGNAFLVKYSDICRLLESMSIHPQIRGKFIIQQSELLANIHQRNTALLEMIEETAGNVEIVKRLGELEKRQKALYAQRESVRQRLREIDLSVEENEEMIAAHTKWEEGRQRKMMLEKEEVENEVRITILSFLLSCISINELSEIWEEGRKEMEALREEEKECGDELDRLEIALGEKNEQRKKKEEEVEMLQEKLETIRSEKRRASHEMQSNQQTLEKLESVREDLHRRKSATEVEVSDGRMNSVIN